MKTKTIKIDINFSTYDSEKLKSLLENGWKIIDKTVVGDRYIYYILQKGIDDDTIGKCSDSL